MNLFKILMLPPTLNVLLVLLGLLLGPKRLRGAALIVLGLAGLLLLATPWASHTLRQGLEPYSPPARAQLESAEAIVILGGGRDYVAPEFGWGDAPANATWRRLAYGALLHRHSELPILVSGGRVHGEDAAEASLMAAALHDVFDVPVRWREGESRTTTENARLSADILRTEGITRIALVSQAWHLPRAVAAFEAQGIAVVPAPTDFTSPAPEGLEAWLPRAYHLNQSTRALNEWLGRVALRLRDWLP
ncbi:YdcF family protein [Billgrantia sp. LNSP4103-1]|uniref:YdcF family protein n=1 Tax=Billgrantia sp. LNSP4103-1 TaxID=3410266 RepID=UPI00403F916A